MKKSSNLNTKQKIIQAFKILKKTYPQIKLVYVSTDLYYWHVAVLHKTILHSSDLDVLGDNDIRFAVIACENNIELLL